MAPTPAGRPPACYPPSLPVVVLPAPSGRALHKGAWRRSLALGLPIAVGAGLNHRDCSICRHGRSGAGKPRGLGPTPTLCLCPVSAHSSDVAQVASSCRKGRHVGKGNWWALHSGGRQAQGVEWLPTRLPPAVRAAAPRCPPLLRPGQYWADLFTAAHLRQYKMAGAGGLSSLLGRRSAAG